MAITPATTRDFHVRLYAGMLQTVTLLKRGNDQRQGTVTAYTLGECRQGMVFKDGQTIQGDMSVRSRCIWHIPKRVLDAAGITFINVLDRIVNLNAPFGVPGYWQAESETEIVRKLFGNFVNIHCLQVDPPNS